MTPADMTVKYLQLRARIKQIEDKHKEELAPYQDVKFRLETLPLDHLNKNGLDSVKCVAGTAFKSTVTSVSVQDWPATLSYIQHNHMWDLLEARVSKTAALEIINESNTPIPGVDISQATVLRVRTA
jgi:hypothetical protein